MINFVTNHEYLQLRGCFKEAIYLLAHFGHMEEYCLKVSNEIRAHGHVTFSSMSAPKQEQLLVLILGFSTIVRNSIATTTTMVEAKEAFQVLNKAFLVESYPESSNFDDNKVMCILASYMHHK